MNTAEKGGFVLQRLQHRLLGHSEQEVFADLSQIGMLLFGKFPGSGLSLRKLGHDLNCSN
jgi:hypothetical protein